MAGEMLDYDNFRKIPTGLYNVKTDKCLDKF